MGFTPLIFVITKTSVYNKHTINVGIVIVGLDIVLEYPRMAQRSTPEGVLVPVVPVAMYAPKLRGPLKSAHKAPKG